MPLKQWDRPLDEACPMRAKTGLRRHRHLVKEGDAYGS